MSEKSRTPWVTLSLVFLNLAMAFLALLAPGFVDKAIFDPAHVTFWTPLTCLFAHQNLLHLLANMIFLAAVGPLIEFTRGSWRFLIIYFVGGLIGVLAHFIFSLLAPPGSPLLGASGSIAACVGYCAIRFARTRVPILPKLGIPVGFIAMVWLLIQAAGSVFQIGDQMRGGVAFWAHLGGFLAGLGFAFLFGGLKEARYEYGHEVLSQMNERGPAAVLATVEAILKQQPKNRAAQWQRIDALNNLHETEKCTDALVTYFESGDSDEKEKSIRFLDSMGRLSSLNSIQRLRYVDGLLPENLDLRLIVLKSIARENDDPRRPDALVSIIDLLKDSEDVSAFVEILTLDFPHHPATEAARQRGLIK
ncbi:MAG: rhomboid family intramembrane serine protease [Fimbriimonadaceae bacterium]